ncbi:putative alcohol dehydrogenase [Mollisia scopiformis]|uniref:Putative alcohol dehydrogenase n=1 Tax=Mollisia scopiformis TaxID=149040 RepID=A0A194WYE9_MOLSC|nr:putative alcohol dehydrogenase [Mollisia scopiformis]KUJ12993.1 putative alcohol dehydrogenase [Mollisia scopiformis]
MTTITDNQAAWQTAIKTRPLEVGPGRTPNPGENEVVIKVAYAAVNPCDFNMQLNPYFDLEYPFIWGVDVAGTVVQLGSKVTRFRLGQRVIGNCEGMVTKKVTNTGYQHYTTCLEIFVAGIPDSLPLANAAVLPLSISTAAAALFIHHKLPFPTLNPKPTGKTVLVWGGSSSCGSSVIQLAVAAGYSVATTASSANFEYVKDLGASHVFNHKDSMIVDEILKVLGPGDLVVDCIGTNETQIACGKIVGKIGGGRLPLLNPPQVQFPEGVDAVFVIALNVGLVNVEVGDAVWRKYIPEALAVRKFQAKPDPLIVEGGLEKVQDALDILRKGVSAKKVVVEISKE